MAAQRRFVYSFIGLILLFYGFYITPFFQQHVLGTVARIDAHLVAAVLRGLGYHTTARADVLSNAQFAVSIKAGCDALQPIGIFWAALLAFPLPLSRKIKALLLGTALLLLINLLRIGTLFLAGVHGSKTLFEWLHFEVWQIVYLLLAIGLFAYFIRRVQRSFTP